MAPKNEFVIEANPKKNEERLRFQFIDILESVFFDVVTLKK